MAPPLSGSPRVVGHRDYVIRALLHGVTGPIDGERYTEVMIPMGQNPDDWVAAIGSYVRNDFGNLGDLITPADVARVRAASTGRSTQWTAAENEASVPRQLVVDQSWKVTASHNTAAASNALSINPWTSGESQRAGMWIQIEVPKAAWLTEVQFSSTAPPEGPVVAGAPTRTSVGGARGAAPGPPPAIGFPIGYQVQVSMDGTTWSAPVAQGAGSGSSTTITFKPVQAKFVKITQTGSTANAPAWTIQRLRLFEVNAPAAR
jgi:hypothetical protein